jgi:hypothetical protein
MKLFTDKEIQEVYETYFLKNQKEYLSKYNTIPEGFHLSNWKLEGKDYPRLRSLMDFKDWIIKYKLQNVKNILVTDFSDPELEFLKYEQLTHIPYLNGVNDLHLLDLAFKSYDFAIFNQTLEHLYNPFLCIQNLYDHLNEGGYLYTTVPTINIPHMVPYHFWGLTPMGLCMLMKSIGFQIVEVGYWGNYDYINKLFNSHLWPDYQGLNNLVNELNNECQCWILVKK